MTRADRRPRRRLDVEQRRRTILASAKKAFSRAAYQQVSLTAIGRDADASEALVLRYFSTKAELYLAVVMSSIDSLLEAQRAADEALGPIASPQQRLATSVEVYLDFVAAHPLGWAGPLRDPSGEPQDALRLGASIRDQYVSLLRDLFGVEPAQPRDHAFRGYLAFLDATCLAWVDTGCPALQRGAIVDMALGALDGALAAIKA